MNRGSEGAVDALVSHSAIRGVSRGGDGMRSCIGIGVGARARVIWGSFVCGGGVEWRNGEQVVESGLECWMRSAMGLIGIMNSLRPLYGYGRMFDGSRRIYPSCLRIPIYHEPQMVWVWVILRP